MVLNNKGQVVFTALMISVTIIVLALALAGPVKEQIDIARNDSSETTIGLNCSNPLITDWDKAACITTDISLPYFIGGLLFIGGAVAAYKIAYE